MSELPPDLNRLADAAELIPPVTQDESTDAQDESIDAQDDSVPEPRVSKATRLLALAKSVTLFHTPGGEAFATFDTNGHRETWPTKSSKFDLWLRRLFFQHEKQALDSNSLKEAQCALEALALFDGQTVDVALRTAWCDDTVYVDLCDDDWRAVQITSQGWEIIASKDLPVPFRRASGMLPLPFPTKGGDLDELHSLLNVASDEYWHLVVAWIVATFFAKGPFPVLGLHGEQGSAKSSATRILRRFIDPNKAPLRSQPANIHDLMISAGNSLLLAFDNLSTIKPWLSDTLCALATGGGFATRSLFTNTDEIIFCAKRPTVLNGIEEVATRADLLDRSLILSLVPIPPSERKTEEELEAAIESVAGEIQGAIFDAVALALRERPNVHLSHPPRMADFAVLGVAVERGLGWPEGAFLAAYGSNRAEANGLPIEASVIGPSLVSFAESEGCDRWPYPQLLGRLNELAQNDTKTQKGWPKTTRALIAEIKRLAPNLRRSGIQVEFGRDRQARWVSISMDPQHRHLRHNRHSEEENPIESSTSVADSGDDPHSGQRHNDASDRHCDGSGEAQRHHPTPRNYSGSDASDASDATAEDLCEESGPDTEGTGVQAEAAAWLLRLFTNRAAEEWLLRIDVHAIGKELEYAAETIELAAGKIGLRSKVGLSGRTSWALPLR